MKELKSEFFTLRELTRSATATRLGIDNTPSDEIIDNLQLLCDKVLDPLHRRWGAAIRVSSGYRCPRLNRVVGGAKGSMHMSGLAADITSLCDIPQINRCLLIILLHSNLPFHKVIIEKPDEKMCPDWIHVQYAKTDKPRRIVRVFDGQGYRPLTTGERKLLKLN